MRINNWGSSIIIIVIMSPAIPGPPTRGTQIIYTEIQADIKSYCKRRLTEHTDNDPLKRSVEKPSETSTSISVALQGILGIAPAVTCVGQKTPKKTLEQGNAWAVYHSNKTLPVKRHPGLKSRAERRPTVSINPRGKHRSTRHRTKSFREERGVKKIKKNSWQMMNYVSKDKGINKRLMCSVFGQENSGGARWQPEI